MRRFTNWMSTSVMAIILMANSTTTQAQGGYDDPYNYQSSGYQDNGYYNNQNGYGATYQEFYDGLSPYGQWIYDHQYGYVWLPDVGPDFRPYYTNGYWAMTEYGNTWVSNYNWGWATFHYGRWTYDNYYGWAWIPGTEWAPAWVSWRSNNNYYGWAPLGPGININVSMNVIPMNWWVFLSPNYFYDRSFYRYCNNDWRYNQNIYRQTRWLSYTNNYNRHSYYCGPRADDYRRRTGRSVSMFDINNDRRRGANGVRGNRISMYRPEIRSDRMDAPLRIAQTDRGLTNRPQTISNTAPEGRREIFSRQPVMNNAVRQQEANPIQQNPRMGGGIRNNPAQLDRDNSMQQQREQQINQQRIQQQRDQQLNQQRAQQQRDAQMQQQRDQQRAQQQRDAQMQQQRDQQLNQQRAQQQRDAQMQQQRDQQLNQQRAQQQRDAQMQREQQMNQQRIQEQRDAQMQQQREQQMNQQRMQQQREQQREAAPVREQRQNTEQEQAQPNTERGRGGFRGR